MKRFMVICIVALFLVVNLELKAQEKEELIYFQIENLSVESYRNWIKTTGKSIQSSVGYSCIPAQIIGVRKEDATLFKNKLTSTYKSVKQIELTQKEAEQKCASKRSF